MVSINQNKSIVNDICFVQFTHPGEEHSIDRGKKNFKNWNYGKHKRKFLRANGSIMQNGAVINNKDLLFWGEWEPQSTVVRIPNVPMTGDFPHYIHTPDLDLSAPLQDSRGRFRQNTDPFVFSDRFYYRCCKQQRFVSLRHLEPGSIILFGSTLKDNNMQPYFGVDTVFVVGAYRDYDSTHYKKQLNNFIPKMYDEIVGIKQSLYIYLTTASRGRSCSILNFQGNTCFRCYAGATPQNPIESMYSFVPCKHSKNGTIGFERLKIRQADLAGISGINVNIITNNLNSAPKITAVNLLQNVNIWNKIRQLNQKQGLLEGIAFKY